MVLVENYSVLRDESAPRNESGPDDGILWAQAVSSKGVDNKLSVPTDTLGNIDY